MIGGENTERNQRKKKGENNVLRGMLRRVFINRNATFLRH